MSENKMRQIRVSKVTLNIGAGTNPDRLAKAVKLLESISGVKAVHTEARKRIPNWEIRPGLAIGTKVIVRGKRALQLLNKLLAAADRKIKSSSFTDNGFSFGIKEYIDIEGMKYDSVIGMMGLDVCVTLERPGFRVKKRKIMPGKIPPPHRIKAEDAREFAIKELEVKVE